MPYKDPEKSRECIRRWYSRNAESERKRIHLRRKELQKWFREYKKTLECIVCGENDYVCLDFHHRNPKEKDLNLANIMKSKGWGKERTIKEISKCLVLCSNCHRKIHAKRFSLIAV